MKRIRVLIAQRNYLKRDWEKVKHHQVVKGMEIVAQAPYFGLVTAMKRKRTQVQLADGRRRWVKDKYIMKRELIEVFI